MRVLAPACVMLLLPGTVLAGICSKFGSPSYQADRTVSIGGETIRSKIFVSGARERQEIAAPGGRTEVRLAAGGAIIIFDPAAKTGMRLPPPPVPKIRLAKENVRIGVHDDGPTKIVKMEVRDDKGDWKVTEEAVCRNDGIILSQQFTVGGTGGQVVSGQMSQSAISVGPQDQALFKLPSDVRLGKQ